MNTPVLLTAQGHDDEVREIIKWLSAGIRENGQMLGIQRVDGFRGCIAWRRAGPTNTA
jgi:hypothetical protein